MKTVKLDRTRLLGFRLLATRQSGAVLGAKVGAQIGEKGGEDARNG